MENREKQHTQRVDLQNGFLILVTRSLGFATERTSFFFFERLQRVCRLEWRIERNSTRNEWICKTAFRYWSHVHWVSPRSARRFSFSNACNGFVASSGESRETAHATSGSAKRLFDTGHTFIGFRHGAHVVFLFRTLATGLSPRVENREKQHTQRVDLQNGFSILVTRSLGFATERTSFFFFERLQRVCRLEWKIERNSTRNEWICKTAF